MTGARNREVPDNPFTPYRENREFNLPAWLPRVGVGTDVHAFAPEEKDQRPCMLAGLEWPGEVPLAGHSDADVAAHAICDALFSAAGLGDLGTHFGVDRPEWKGRSGRDFLEETIRLLNQAGWAVGNVAVQVIAKRPHMQKRYQAAREALESVIQAPVSVSATTSDSLGFTGRGEGAAAVATALIYPRGLNSCETDVPDLAHR